MAEDDLIEKYLLVLGRTIHPFRHARDLTEEISDHLQESTERLMSSGLSRADAEAQAVRLMGEPHLLAISLTRRSSGGVALPSVLSRVAGAAGIMASAGWLMQVVLTEVSGLQGVNPAHLIKLSLVVTVMKWLLTVVALTGAMARSGGTRDRSAYVAVLALLVAASLGAAQAVPVNVAVWDRSDMVLIGILTSAVSIFAGQRWLKVLPGLPRWPAWALMAAWPVCTVGVLVGRAVFVNAQYSIIQRLLWQSFGTLGWTIFASALAAFGVVLARETPVSVNAEPQWMTHAARLTNDARQ